MIRVADDAHKKRGHLVVIGNFIIILAADLNIFSVYGVGVHLITSLSDINWVRHIYRLVMRARSIHNVYTPPFPSPQSGAGDNSEIFSRS